MVNIYIEIFQISAKFIEILCKFYLFYKVALYAMDHNKNLEIFGMSIKN